MSFKECDWSSFNTLEKFKKLYLTQPPDGIFPHLPNFTPPNLSAHKYGGHPAGHGT